MAVFDAAPPAEVRAGLSAMLRTPEPRIDDLVRGTEDELLFHVLTTPRLRERFLRMGAQPVAPGMMIRGALMTEASTEGEVARLHEELLALPDVSDHLRARVS